jgi:D-arabinose 1-dehydrogenase-like Zn-dependent alcohol dehydrogenase
MRAAALTEYCRPLELVTLPDPTLPDDGAVVRVLACGICRSDFHVWNGDWRWRMQVTFPHILGHECVGEVAAIGPETRGWSVGDRVVVPFHLDCGKCPQCARGAPNLCDRYTAIGFQVPGAFAELLAVPAADRNLMRLDPTVDPVVAAGLGCRLMTAWHALRDQVSLAPGDRVAIFGGGGLGLSALVVARAAGAVTAVIDPNPEALALARANGADIILGSGEFTPADLVARLGGPPTVTVDAAGHRTAAGAALAVLAKGGTHLQLGLSGAGEDGAFPLPIDRIVKAELRILGSVGCPQPSYRRLLAAMARGELNLDGLAPSRGRLDVINTVLAGMRAGHAAGLTVAIP